MTMLNTRCSLHFMQDNSGDLSQDELLRRLTTLMIQVGNIPHPVESICESSWREGLLVGLCVSTAIAGGAGVHGEMPLNELAGIGLDLARSVDWTLRD